MTMKFHLNEIYFKSKTSKKKKIILSFRKIYIFASENQVQPTKKQRSSVQIQSTYICRIAFCKGEASWFGAFLE